MRLHRSIILTCALLASVGTACELLVGHDLQFDAPPADGGPSAIDGGNQCASLQPPSAGSDDGGASAQATFFLVVRSLELGGPGFDQDRACTCCACDDKHGAGSSCTPPAGQPDGGSCDTDGGVDNQATAVLANLPAGLAGRLSGEAAPLIECGRRSILIALYDYNGLRNDAQVHISTTTLYGIREPHDAGDDASAGASDNPDGSIACSEPAGNPFYRPRWDGTDVWSVAPSATASNGIPYENVFNASVSDYQLVLDSRPESANLDRAITIALFGGAKITMRSPIMLATLIPLDGNGSPIDGGSPQPAASFALSGQMAGRFQRDEIVRSLAYAPVDMSGTPLCQFLGGSLFDKYKPTFCSGADIAVTAPNDFTGAPCDAFSVTMSFVAFPAVAGASYDGGDDLPDATCDASQLSCDPD